MARLYVDENFSYPAVEQLREAGHDVLTAQEAGQAGQGKTDEQVLAFALASKRAVITFNRRHFVRLHARAPSHFGILVCSRDPNVIALADRIDRAISVPASLQNRLIRVNRPNAP